MTHQEQQGDSVTLTGRGGGKRTASNFGEAATKRIKMTHLHSDSPSQGVSQLLDSRRAVLPGEVSPVVAPPNFNRVDTAGALEPNATTSSRVEKHTQVPFARGIPIDLNIQDVTVSANQGSTHLSQIGKSRDVSECGSTTGPATVKDKDPLTRWNEMKQNGFLSCPHHGLLPGAAVASSSQAKIPVPKQRPKKSKARVLPKKMESTPPQKKKKMESVKGEHADRFAKIAAPSGLLNGLNLGIINHVRNKKQVHSIIEALLRSETLENGHSQHKQASHAKYVPKETMAPVDTGKLLLGPSHGIEGLSSLSTGNKNFTLPVPTGHSGSGMLDKIGNRDSVSHHAAIKDVESLRTEVLSSAKACEESSTFSNEASANTSSVSLLSTRAANAAAQWLELLNQDIKGRLSALRRSKKRVRSVVTTELPFLISKEFSTDQENVFCYTNGSLDGLANNTLASMHLARWTKLFDQMDGSLSEEEKQLESWLYDVREMQLQCEHGLQSFHLPGAVGSQHQGTLEYSKRNEQADRSTMELAVRAAAASIYSTCNFVMPKDNVPCF